ncbi:MAG: [NiFe]-hydrogenase assembly chaperone HybE [Rhodoferax sp.]|nr:[NiFe]-hydrogenase assembly chaperone HybE [Rhodoferax sp.]MCF8208247.1 [NiFe]-hydrogenase assembly chaperone HybE [Rhodoferax sp.]
MTAPGPRRPALAPPPLRIAEARPDNPQALLQRHYQRVWETRMQDMPFVNPSIRVEAMDFVRQGGDWLGVVVTPWFLYLFLLNGGGALWKDLSAGQRQLVALPCGALQFIADDDPDLGLYQYCPLISALGSLADHATARQAALDAMHAVLTPALPPSPMEPAPALPSATQVAAPAASRRDFFRKIGGRS